MRPHGRAPRPALAVVALLLLAAAGCRSESTPAPALPPADPPLIEAAAAPSLEPPVAAEPADIAPASEPAVSAPDGEGGEDADAAEVVEVVEDLDAACRAACDNVLALTLGELPAGSQEPMRQAIRSAVTRDCPPRCREKATPEGISCVRAARHARDIAACPF